MDLSNPSKVVSKTRPFVIPYFKQDFRGDNSQIPSTINNFFINEFDTEQMIRHLRECVGPYTNIEKVRRELLWHPRVSCTEGIDRLIHWVRENQSLFVEELYECR